MSLAISPEINPYLAEERANLIKELESRIYRAEQSGNWTRKRVTMEGLGEASRALNRRRTQVYEAEVSALRDALKGLTG